MVQRGRSVVRGPPAEGRAPRPVLHELVALHPQEDGADDREDDAHQVRRGVEDLVEHAVPLEHQLELLGARDHQLLARGEGEHVVGQVDLGQVVRALAVLDQLEELGRAAVAHEGQLHVQHRNRAVQPDRLHQCGGALGADRLPGDVDRVHVAAG